MHLRTDTGANSHFANVPTISRSRNSFSIAKKHVSTMQFDTLYPIYTKYIMPGDTISISEKIMARLQTQGWILYDDLYLDVHAWFVPHRLTQENWARYQFNAQPLGPTQDNSALHAPIYTMPSEGTVVFPSKSIYDYLGLPVNVPMGTVDPTLGPQKINTYAERAYKLVWNENYRDENLQDAVSISFGDGPDPISNTGSLGLLKRGKRHDKFTSALPFLQKGPAASIPIGGTAPVLRTSNAEPWQAFNANSNTLAGPSTGSGKVGMVINGISGQVNNDANSGGITPISLDPGNFGLYADLGLANAITVNQLRQSIVVQHLLEADARGGTRDVESIQHRWGVTVPDFRLQRPEYLGGQTFSFDGHVVPQTSASTDDSPQANLAQFSQTLTSMNINHSFVEHGIFMILLSARSNMTYQQGLEKPYSYYTRFDWYQPEFANIGEVAIKNKEVLCAFDADDDDAWGYNEYGYELRYEENMVTAEMRSNYAQSLDMKHMAYDFASRPVLGPAFIQSATPIGRNIAVQVELADPIELNMLTLGKIARTLPMYSVPGLYRL